MRPILAALAAVSLAACSHHPVPPTVDGADRQPVNNSAVSEVLMLRQDVARMTEELRRTQAMLRPPRASAAVPPAPSSSDPYAINPNMPAGRFAPVGPTPAGTVGAGPAAAAPAATAPAPAASRAPDAEKPSAPGPVSRVFQIRFGYNKVAATVPDSLAREIIDSARRASLVEVRGRTDGQSATPGEVTVAKGRADFARDWLIAYGIPAERIKTSYLPSTDFIADNSTRAGRARNRRVEIETRV